MSHDSTIEETADAALRILRDTFPSVCSIVTSTLLKKSGRSLVLRCMIASDGDAPASAIVKRSLANEECGFSDWGSLRFIGMERGCAGLAPRLYGGDAGNGVYIMEDLGSSMSIDDLLRGEDQGAAVEALMGLAEKCAMLHRSTAGHAREEEFIRIRGALPGSGRLGRHHEAERWNAALDRIGAWFASAGAPMDGRFEGECGLLAKHYAEPGGFLAFTHGDIAPSNNHVRDGAVHLIDFEYGGFRHALYDMAVWNVLCPLPEPLMARLLEHYRMHYLREERAQDFAREWDLICAWRSIGMLGWFGPEIMERNRGWIEEWSSRDAFLRTVRMTARSAQRLEDMQGIARSFEGLAEMLATKWSETEGTIPEWRALRGI